jgi:hypothetical protein
MPGDDLNDPTARARNWARAQIDRRREMEERQEAWDKAHTTSHPWKLDPHLHKVPLPGVIEFADLYVIFDPKPKR